MGKEKKFPSILVFFALKKIVGGQFLQKNARLHLLILFGKF